MKPVPREQQPTFAQARRKAAEKGRAVSAPTPAAPGAQLAPRPPRKTWGGKYDQLAPKAGDSQDDPPAP